MECARGGREEDVGLREVKEDCVKDSERWED